MNTSNTNKQTSAGLLTYASISWAHSKRIVGIFSLIIMILTLPSCTVNKVKGSVALKTSAGNAVLDIMPQKLLEKVNVGDVVIITIGDFKEEMPVVEELIAEDEKLQLLLDRDGWSISICIYNGDFCDTYGIDIGEKVLIEKNN